MTTREEDRRGRKVPVARALPRSARWIAPALLLGLMLPARVAFGAPPSGEEVLAKAVAAMGGVEAMQALHSRWMRGRMEIPAMGLSAPLESYAARPNRTRTSIRSEAIGNLEEGGDGEFFWEQSAMAGPKLKKGPELARAKREADFDGLTNWKAWYKSAETLGADTLEGRPAWKVRMTPNEGNAETLWFDQESGLPLRQASVAQTDQGDIPVEVSLLDYREVGGVKVPFRLRQSVMNGVQVIEIITDSLEVNVEVPPGTFDPPPEVRALIEKEKAGPAPAGK